MEDMIMAVMKQFLSGCNVSLNKNSASTGNWSHDLRVTAATLYQQSCELVNLWVLSIHA